MGNFDHTISVPFRNIGDNTFNPATRPQTFMLKGVKGRVVSSTVQTKILCKIQNEAGHVRSCAISDLVVHIPITIIETINGTPKPPPESGSTGGGIMTNEIINGTPKHPPESGSTGEGVMTNEIINGTPKPPSESAATIPIMINEIVNGTPKPPPESSATIPIMINEIVNGTPKPPPESAATIPIMINEIVNGTPKPLPEATEGIIQRKFFKIPRRKPSPKSGSIRGGIIKRKPTEFKYSRQKPPPKSGSTGAGIIKRKSTKYPRHKPPHGPKREFNLTHVEEAIERAIYPLEKPPQGLKRKFNLTHVEQAIERAIYPLEKRIRFSSPSPDITDLPRRNYPLKDDNSRKLNSESDSTSNPTKYQAQQYPPHILALLQNRDFYIANDPENEEAENDTPPPLLEIQVSQPCEIPPYQQPVQSVQIPPYQQSVQSVHSNSNMTYPLRRLWKLFDVPRFPVHYNNCWTIPGTIKSDSGTTFELGMYVGKGAYGYVFKGTNKTDGSMYACKVQYWDPSDSVEVRALKQEVEFHKTLNHESVLKYIDSFINGNNFCLITELCMLGSLADACRTRLPSKEQARFFAHQLLTGLKYLHEEAMIVHCDIKPENLLFNSKFNLKICDFGLARKLCYPSAGVVRMVGSPNYMSPEIIDGLNGRHPDFAKTDIWSAGVVIVTLYQNNEPFGGNDSQDTFRRIRTYKWEKRIVRIRDIDAAKLLDKIFVPVTQRVTASEALQSVYLTEGRPRRVSITSLAINGGFYPNHHGDLCIKKHLERLLSKGDELVNGAELKEIPMLDVLQEEDKTVKPSELYRHFPIEVHESPRGFGYVLRNGGVGQFNIDTSVSFMEPWKEFKFVHSLVPLNWVKGQGYPNYDPVNSESRFAPHVKIIPQLVPYAEELKLIPQHTKYVEWPTTGFDINAKIPIHSPRLRWFNLEKTQLLFDNGTIQTEVNAEEYIGKTEYGEKVILVGNNNFLGYFKLDGTILEHHDLRNLHGKLETSSITMGLGLIMSVVEPLASLKCFPVQYPFGEL